MLKIKQLIVLAIVSLVGTTAIAADPAATAQPATVKMAYEAGTMLPISTKSRIIDGGKTFTFNGDSGEIDINGKPTKLAAKYDRARNVLGLGLDMNQDGTVEDKEFLPTQNGACGFKFKGADGRDCQIVIGWTSPGMDKSGTIKSLRGGYYPNYCMKGMVEKQVVKLIDDNMDGVFTQDGKDVIILGNTTYAVPLYKMHMIAGKHYQLEVASDGASITATLVTDLKLGLVEAPLLVPATKTLVMVDEKDGRAYDLVTAAKIGIPEGTYSFSYALVTSGPNALAVTPTKPQTMTVGGGRVVEVPRSSASIAPTPDYPITGDMINVLTLGPTFKLYYHATKSGNKITVYPEVGVYGSGNEYYAMKFSSGGKGTPCISMLNGKQLLTKEFMEYG